jgi:hypothetical protein
LEESAQKRSHTCNGLRGKRLLIFALEICDSILLA